MAAVGFHSLSEWSFTICPTPYNSKFKKCVECIVKTFPFFNSLPSESACRNSSSTVSDDSLFTVNRVSILGFSERLRKT